MKYFISLKNPLTHFFTVRLELDNIDRDRLMLELPIWRPGRYEATNYAKNVRGFKVQNKAGDSLEYEKLNPSSWSIKTKNSEQIIVTYDYFAFKMDGGSSFYDEEQVYINFINCLMYDPEMMNEACSLSPELPEHYQVACGLERKGAAFVAKDYYQLVDSPLIAAAELESYTYDCGDTNFHIWINGKHSLDTSKMISDFEKFSATQIDVMGGFPEKEYHFLLQVLPYKFYHGVEHYNSTVICLGPGEALNNNELYTQLLGVSSHELFHAWNIIRIRPKELAPYQFNREVAFPTGFVAEGFTTYYGDLFLVRSGVFTQQEFFHELNTLFKRHFWNFGRLNYSLTDSSLDLWIDGYAINAPDRKSSIYVEGAMVALCLDLMIRKKTTGKKSLDDVIRTMWHKHGQPEVGYTYEDVKSTCEEVYGSSLDDFFLKHVKGTAPKEELIDELLQYVGCRLVKKEADDDLARLYGIRISTGNGTFKIVQIAPGSIGEEHFSYHDEILSINGEEAGPDNPLKQEPHEILIKRNHKERIIKLQPKNETYFNYFEIMPLEAVSHEQEAAFKDWTGSALSK